MQVKTARQLLDEWAVNKEERAWLGEVMAAAAAACGSAAADAAKDPEAPTAALWSRLGEVGVFELAGEGAPRALEIALIGFTLGTHRAPGPLAATVMAVGALEGTDAAAVRGGGPRRLRCRRGVLVAFWRRRRRRAGPLGPYVAAGEGGRRVGPARPGR